MAAAIFLDVDGVLNSVDYVVALNGKFKECALKMDPVAVARINQVTDVTGAMIVVSSVWRMHYEKLEDMISHFQSYGFTGKIIDRTPCGGKCRGDEIEEWMDKNSSSLDIKKFAIVDDSDDMGSLGKFLVRTNLQHGIQEEHVKEIINRLK